MWILRDNGGPDIQFSSFRTLLLQTRHQQGDTFPLTVEEILDETNQLDIGAKHKHWLSTEVKEIRLL